MARWLLSLFLALFVAAFGSAGMAAEPINLQIDVILPPKGEDFTIEIMKAVPQADGSVKLEADESVNTAGLKRIRLGEKHQFKEGHLKSYKAPASEFEAGRLDVALPPGKYVIVTRVMTPQGTIKQDVANVSDSFEVAKDGKPVRLSIREVGKTIETTKGAPAGDIGVPRDKVKQALKGKGYNTDALTLGELPATDGELALGEVPSGADQGLAAPADIARETAGFEKTFLDGAASFGLRLPFGMMAGGPSVHVTQVAGGNATNVKGGGDTLSAFVALQGDVTLDLTRFFELPTVGGYNPTVGALGFIGAYNLGGKQTDERSLDAVNPISPDTFITTNEPALGGGFGATIGLTDYRNLHLRLQGGVIGIHHDIKVDFQQPPGTTEFDLTLHQWQPMVGADLSWYIGDAIGLPATIGFNFLYAFAGGSQSETKLDVFNQPVTVEAAASDFWAAGLNIGIELRY